MSFFGAQRRHLIRKLAKLTDKCFQINRNIRVSNFRVLTNILY